MRRTMRSIEDKRTVWRRVSVRCCAVAFAWAGLTGAFGQTVETRSAWDMGIQEVEVKGVHIHTNGLVATWQAMQQGVHFRTILVMVQGQPSDSKLEFDAEKCTVADTLTAFFNAYPNYTYTQDKNTGIIWLHPKMIAYESILAAKVKLASDVIGVPMLGTLSQLRPFGVRLVGRMLTGVANTFGYPVDIPAGTWSVREVLNFCCVADPSTAILVSLSSDGTCSVMPTSIFNIDTHEVTPTMLYFWRSEIDSSSQGVPTEDQVIDALASPDARTRAAARNYCSLCGLAMDPDELVRHAPAGDKAFWTAVGMLDVHVRSRGATHTASIERIRQTLSDKSSASISPNLRVLASAELVRVLRGHMAVIEEGKNPPPSLKAKVQRNLDDALGFLDQATKISLASHDVANVKHDMTRVLRYSKPVRDKLIEQKVQWPGFSQADIEALGDPNIFSLP